jgi:Tol biopolymer transport system component
MAFLTTFTHGFRGKVCGGDGLMRMKPTICALLLLAVPLLAPAQDTREVPLPEAGNAYNPIPSSDGKLIAYVGTGWRKYGIVGLGRASLRSEIAVMTVEGRLLTHSPLADAFLFGWAHDSRDVLCYRDGRYLLVNVDGTVVKQGREVGAGKRWEHSERAAYLAKSNTFVWVEHRESARTVVLTDSGVVATNAAMTGNLVVPSPDERYLALIGNGMDMWVYDTQKKTWANLGNAVIHPDKEWDYIKPSWNPWFADSAQLVFLSGSRLLLASPDGQHQQVLLDSVKNAGIPVPSPDGRNIAYAIFVPRPMKVRHDLTFWGGATLWTLSTDGSGKPQRITSSRGDTTYDLKWVGNDRIVFDRIAEDQFYSSAGLWMVPVAP